MKKDVIWPCRVSAVVLTIDAEGNYSLQRMNQEGDISVAFITGEAVGSKEHDASNPIVRRIESNKDLFVSVHDDFLALHKLGCTKPLGKDRNLM